MTNPTYAQVHAYLLAHGWERRPDDPPGCEHWVHPTYGEGYPYYGITFRTAEVEASGWGRLDLETFAIHEGRCEHEILADMLGQPDAATLLKRIDLLQKDITALAAVGDLYLRSLDEDPANELLSLAEAFRVTEIRVTEIREAVERAGYDVRWEAEGGEARNG